MNKKIFSKPELYSGIFHSCMPKGTAGITDRIQDQKIIISTCEEIGFN